MCPPIGDQYKILYRMSCCRILVLILLGCIATLEKFLSCYRTQVNAEKGGLCRLLLFRNIGPVTPHFCHVILTAAISTGIYDLLNAIHAGRIGNATLEAIFFGCIK